jgi:hypothetical protein
MGILGRLFDPKGDGLLGGIGEGLRDVAPIMSAIGNNQDIGTAQFRVQQMQDRRYLRAQDEMLKKQAAVMAERMGLDPALASSPETVFSIYKAQKAAEIEKANRAPREVQTSWQERMLGGVQDPVRREQLREQMLSGGRSGAVGPDGRPLTPAQEIAQEKFRLQQEATQQQQELSNSIKQEGADVMRDVTADTVDAVEKGRVMIPGTGMGVDTATGAIGSILKHIPMPSKAREVAANLETIKGSVAFGKLAQMRDASKTGGALGAIAVQELNMLQATLGSLDQAADGPTFLRKLKEVETRYQRLNSLADRMGVKGDTAPSAPTGAASGGSRRVYDAQGNRVR